MGSLRHHVPALLVYAAVFMACVVLAATPACSGSQRQKTLRATVISVNAARDGFLAWDAEHQHGIVEHATSREQGEQELATYRAKRIDIVAGFELVYRSISVAATQNDDPSLRSALDASKAILDAIKKLMGGS